MSINYKFHLNEIKHCFIAVAILLLIGNSPANAQFSTKQDGKIDFNGREYSGFSQYFLSREFQQAGSRCQLENKQNARFPQWRTQGELQNRSLSDCTTAITAISDEYAPTEIAFEIPVWFHVIYNSSGEGNISDSDISGQIEVLNQDFRALAGSAGAAGFDVKVQFVIEGITRTQNDAWFTDSTSDEDAYKNALNRDPNRFLNIYSNDAGGRFGIRLFTIYRLRKIL